MGWGFCWARKQQQGEGRDAAGGTGGLCWGSVRAGLSRAAPPRPQFSFSK